MRDGGWDPGSSALGIESIEDSAQKMGINLNEWSRVDQMTFRNKSRHADGTS